MPSHIVDSLFCPLYWYIYLCWCSFESWPCRSERFLFCRQEIKIPNSWVEIGSASDILLVHVGAYQPFPILWVYQFHISYHLQVESWLGYLFKDVLSASSCHLASITPDATLVKGILESFCSNQCQSSLWTQMHPMDIHLFASISLAGTKTLVLKLKEDRDIGLAATYKCKTHWLW